MGGLSACRGPVPVHRVQGGLIVPSNRRLGRTAVDSECSNALTKILETSKRLNGTAEESELGHQ